MANKFEADVGKPKWRSTGGSFHQNTGPQQEQRQGYLNGAFTGSTPQDVINANRYGGNTGGNKTGGSKSSSSTYGYSGGGGTYDATGVWQAYLDRLTADAQAAYERNMAAISNAYDNSAGSLRGNYESAKNTLDASAARSRNAINVDAEGAMRQAYINNMLSRRDLEQSLAARGLSGGATETTRASMENNYGNARNNIDTQRNSSLSELEAKYQESLAQALQAYNSQMAALNQWRAGAEMQANNALTGFQQGYAQNFSQLAPSNDAYLAALAALNNDMNGFSFTGATANNTYNGANMTQAAAADMGGNYAEYLAQQNIMSQPATKDAAFKAYQNGQMSQEDLISWLNRYAR